MFDETRDRIMRAAMELLKAKGYATMTTRDIAREAGVNECTIFRKFPTKKDIVLAAMQEDEWRPDLENAFDPPVWELETDLRMFLRRYLERVTPEMVQLSIGLRAPQLYADTAERIREIPRALLDAVRAYLEEMQRRCEVRGTDLDALALGFTAAAFGFAFFQASFGDSLAAVSKETYVDRYAEMFAQGVRLERGGEGDGAAAGV